MCCHYFELTHSVDRRGEGGLRVVFLCVVVCCKLCGRWGGPQRRTSPPGPVTWQLC